MMNIHKLLQRRYATKKFTGEKVQESVIDDVKKAIELSATSFGLQPFKVLIIRDDETKLQLLGASYNQEQITTCSHLLVFCTDSNIGSRIDAYEQKLLAVGTPAEQAKGYTNMMRGSVGTLTGDQLHAWASKQAYIGLANAMNSVAEHSFDSCPMEGFDAGAYAKILQLPDNLKPAVALPIGVAADKPRPKLRFHGTDLFIDVE
jgi:nitroreductase / dihydropteridine reductase